EKARRGGLIAISELHGQVDLGFQFGAGPQRDKKKLPILLVVKSVEAFGDIGWNGHRSPANLRSQTVNFLLWKLPGQLVRAQRDILAELPDFQVSEVFRQCHWCRSFLVVRISFLVVRISFLVVRISFLFIRISLGLEPGRTKYVARDTLYALRFCLRDTRNEIRDTFSSFISPKGSAGTCCLFLLRLQLRCARR